MSKNIHVIIHRRIRQIGFLLRLPKHLIFHNQEYGWNWEFILCDEPCGYCFDGFYDSLDCQKCYPNDKFINPMTIEGHEE